MVGGLTAVRSFIWKCRECVTGTVQNHPPERNPCNLFLPLFTSLTTQCLLRCITPMERAPPSGEVESSPPLSVTADLEQCSLPQHDCSAKILDYQPQRLLSPSPLSCSDNFTSTFAHCEGLTSTSLLPHKSICCDPFS